MQWVEGDIKSEVSTLLVSVEFPRWMGWNKLPCLEMDDERVESSLVGHLVFKWTCAIWGKGCRLCRGHQKWSTEMAWSWKHSLRLAYCNLGELHSRQIIKMCYSSWNYTSSVTSLNIVGQTHWFDIKSLTVELAFVGPWVDCQRGHINEITGRPKTEFTCRVRGASIRSVV